MTRWVGRLDGLLAVVDGDTFRCTLEVWPRVIIRETVRVWRIDCPEKSDRAAWQAAKDYTAAWLTRAGSITVTAEGYDSFGRVLAVVEDARGANLGSDLIQAGQAVPYDPRRYDAEPETED